MGFSKGEYINLNIGNVHLSSRDRPDGGGEGIKKRQTQGRQKSWDGVDWALRWNPSSSEVRAGMKGRCLEAGTDAEAIDEFCLLASCL